MSRTPLIIAHRGASAHAPENTIAAFELGIDQGADGVEFDVQLARDGIAVVIHDTNLKRTAGRPENVADLTSEQLSEVDVGSWFNERYPKRAKAEYAGQTVPTLEGVLGLLENGSGPIYIELKCELSNYKPLAAAVCSMLRGSALLPRVIVKSFRLAAIPEIRCLLPEVRTAALFQPSILTVLRRRKHIVAIAREFGAHELSLHRSLATRKLTQLAADAGMPVTVWTVDDPKWLTRCRQRGIGTLITNDPLKLVTS